MADRSMNIDNFSQDHNQRMMQGVERVSIRLPNGRTIRGIPKGTPKEDIMRKAIAAGIATEADFGIQTSPQQPPAAVSAPTQEREADTTPSVVQNPQERTPEQQSWLGQAAGYMGNEIYKPLADLAATIGSSAAAPAIAGLAGLGTAALSSVSDDYDMDDAANVVKEVQDMLTYRPRTDKVKNLMGAVGELVAPVAEVMEDTKTGLGDFTLDQTGSPAMAAMAYTAPDAVLSLIGLGRPVSGAAMRDGRRAANVVRNRPTAREVDSFISETPLEAKAIREGAKKGFKQLESARFTFSNEGLNNIEKGLYETLGRYSLHQGKAGHATIENGMARLRAAPNPRVLDEFYDDLTQLANKNSQDLSGVMAIQAKNALLDFMDNPHSRNFKVHISQAKKEGMSPNNVIKTYLNSKKLWRRGKRLDEVEGLIERARIKSLSGVRTFDDALKSEVERIRLNDKQMRLFNKEEIEAMDDLLRGGKSDKVAKLLGTMEYSNNKQTSILMGALSGGAATAGAATAGAAGAATGGIGTLALLYGINHLGRGARLGSTRARGAALQRTIAAAGTDGKKLARAYMEMTPKAQRNPAELAKMLTDPRIDIDMEVGKSNKFMQDAIKMARGYRLMARAEMTGALGVAGAQRLSNDLASKQEEENQ